ncbi:Peptide deformylase [Pseudovibrio axinellae]|uniref:Peptide deformylase n=1 Tax=Pseudovibrio axinellae TaxID=989403 RepID=A0A166B843_9HYPH|nr:peptide deformylase [Pseudovibrio axinellae]KZL22002.1 Peptide deformylase [Pseudovibrio axinellae]SEQ59183.1 peptide deformylase [Pseudovibrio axinellae]
MTIRQIKLIPETCLREVCAPIEDFNEEIKKLADDMLETMYDAPGIGLAASQIAVLKRIVVLDVAERENEEDDSVKKEPMVFINPVITWSSEEKSVYQEGCLSIPGVYEDVERPSEVRVSFLDIDGKQQEIEANGLLGTCIQHEIDHLNGVLFIDYLSRLKRERIVKKMIKQAKQG